LQVIIDDIVRKLVAANAYLTTVNVTLESVNQELGDNDADNDDNILRNLTVER
jgi:hypothetical protein